MAVRSNYVYWAESDWERGAGAVKMVSVNGGTVTTITSNRLNGCGGWYSGLAVEGFGVYLSETSANYLDYAGQVRGVIGVAVDNPTLLSQTPPTVVADHLFHPIGVALDNDSVYWIESDSLLELESRRREERSESGRLDNHVGSESGRGRWDCC